MADEPRTPIEPDVEVGVEDLGRSAGREAGSSGRWPDLEDLRRARAARAWVHGGRQSSDPAVARQVLVEYREAKRRWTRFQSWWSKVLLAGFALVSVVAVVGQLSDGVAVGAVFPLVGLLLCIFFTLIVAPWIEARRAPEMAQAAADAQALLDRSGRS